MTPFGCTPRSLPRLMVVAGSMVAQVRVSGQNAGLTQTGSVSAPVTHRALQPIDVFALQRAGDPQISPDGRSIVFERHFMDEMKDRERTNLWIVASDGSELRPLTTGIRNDGSPRWSPDGNRLAYVSNHEEGAQIWIRWL